MTRNPIWRHPKTRKRRSNVVSQIAYGWLNLIQSKRESVVVQISFVLLQTELNQIKSNRFRVLNWKEEKKLFRRQCRDKNLKREKLIKSNAHCVFRCLNPSSTWIFFCDAQAEFCLFSSHFLVFLLSLLLLCMLLIYLFLFK